MAETALELDPSLITAVVVPPPVPVVGVTPPPSADDLVVVVPVPGVPGPQGDPGPRGEQGLPGEIIGGASPAYVDSSIDNHVFDPTPHPAYDDMPDLVLLFENGLL